MSATPSAVPAMDLRASVARTAVVAALVGFSCTVGAGSAPAEAVVSFPAPTRAMLTVQLLPSDLPPPEGKAADPAEIKRQADEITSQPEYQPPAKSLTERAVEEFQKFLGRITNTLTGGGFGSAFGWVCLLVLAGGVAYLVYRVGRTVQRSPEHTPEVTIEVHRSPTEWRTEAAAFEAKGQWKEALRCRYRAMVADLVDSGIVPDIPGRTVGEHRFDVSVSVPDASAEFHGAAELFEKAWYGDLPTGESENQQFRELSERVVERAGR